MSIQTALVTGAGAGTGKEYVKLLLADGARVISVSLLKNELDDLAHELKAAEGRLIIKQADLSEADASEKLLEWCDEQGYEVDVLVNNAGFAAYGEPTEVDLEKVEKMLMLNVISSTKLSVLFGRRMKARGRGKILVMGSSAGFSPTRRFGAYSASKAYTNNFTCSLGAELKDAGVTVTLVAPGSFKSNFATAADITNATGKSGMRKIYEREKLDAPAVAKAGYQALLKGKPSITVGSKGQMAKVLSRLVPPVTMARVSKGL